MVSIVLIAVSHLL